MSTAERSSESEKSGLDKRWNRIDLSCRETERQSCEMRGNGEARRYEELQGNGKVSRGAETADE